MRLAARRGWHVRTTTIAVAGDGTFARCRRAGFNDGRVREAKLAFLTHEFSPMTVDESGMRRAGMSAVCSGDARRGHTLPCSFHTDIQGRRQRLL